MKHLKHPVMALYGSVSLEKMYCRNCKTEAFVKRGLFTCCDSPVPEVPKKYIRESSAPLKRFRPGKSEQRKILEEQENRCFYCGYKFGNIVHRNDNGVVLKMTWDHMLPWSLTQDNRASNFVAACHVCNGIKNSRVFESMSDAQDYLKYHRRRKGYDF